MYKTVQQSSKMFVFTNFSQISNHLWEIRDKRVDNYYLLGSSFPTIFLSCFYLLTSIYILPWFMKNKKPFNLRIIITIYNFFMVAVNAYQAWHFGWNGKYKLICEPVDTSNSAHAIWITKICYLYYLTKILDLLDTVFFLLRKKNNQVSVLHLYHHGVMPFNSWLTVRFLPGGHITSNGLMNSFIHVVMYTYYGIASLGPEWRKYLWWKKYVTIMQMIQFVIAISHNTAMLLFDCDVPKFMPLNFLFHAVAFLLLFSNFYNKAYNKQQSVGDGRKTE